VVITTLASGDDTPAPNEIPIVALDHALDRLKEVDQELARLVELRALAD
jgi:hypothetical protein